MTRILVYHTLGFMLGIFLGDFFHVPLGAAFALSLAALLFALFVMGKRRDPKLLLVFTLFAGLFWGQVHHPEFQPDLFKGEDDFHGAGLVISDPRPTATGQIFTFKPEEVNHLPVSSIKLQVLCSSEDKVSYGDQLVLSGKVLPGSRASNPGQFDYDAYLKRHGIGATVSTLYGGQIEATGVNRGNLFLHGVYKIKDRMDLVLSYLPVQQSNFIGGMLFGNKGDLTFAERNVLSQTGLMDAFAVSGVHVGYVILFTLYFAQLLHLGKWGRLLLVGAAMLFYAALSEFTPSVLRSGFMALLGLAAYSLGERKDFFTGLALAAMLLLIWQPQMLYDAGFQLSFVAAWGVVYLTPTVGNWLPKGKVWDVLASTIAAHLAITPLIAYYFNLVTISGFLVGILATGLVGLVVLLGLFSVFLSVISINLAVLPAYGAGLVVAGIWHGAQLIAQIPGAYLTVKTPGSGGLALIYIFLIALPYIVQKQNRRIYGILGILVLAFYLLVPLPSSNQLQVTFLDVGQGDCIFIQSPSGRTCLIDGGGKTAQQEDRVGEQVVVPFLRHLGLGKLDLAILTHPHDDHMRGMETVLKELRVDHLVVGEIFLTNEAIQPLLTVAEEDQVPIIPVKEGQEIGLDGEITLTVLNPPRGDAGKVLEEDEMNNESVVLMLNYQDVSFLLTGDVEKERLARISPREDVSAQVIKLPHHGSKTGLLPSFYDQVDPRAAVITVGKNSFGHPNREFLAYWEDKGIPIYRTDHHGAITFTTDGQELWVETFLDKALEDEDNLKQDNF
ncbi:DNA internalization-related competence protein ComEC/Rec2 [Dehalobacterium formicoaceticum]|uniref:DNA internalization-related competence protein ComEC/Rec2 n=1 Tax=Dehalobacterium formicoaceticum TaxID=51515 RepID=A0ABT1Y250_9FIRM|nr:DNA internalization-related competence protein ComEC/Rec2 [Dehalobacterium formicoaceticum]MCR6544955.1 DNA internalization-related competence protein ComEC/Rec2 [Dehalobacterium formicoaceticum]